ncbi:hypothetical protein [uncultured Roseibium sp.]|uniref:hypothetical protein n=1 Tax=uncultured Roseibium sp. TaxID=1936171 RepID=UPI00260359FB|nr:hypothetical protein [uncultured Roseibium sp.]
MSMNCYSLFTSVDGEPTSRDLELRITDDMRLVWGKDPVRDARPLAEVIEIRLWAEKPKIADPAGRALIKFTDGMSVKVSGAFATGAPDTIRARTYLEFLRHLHRCLAPGHKRNIRFLRGTANGSPAKGWTVFAVSAGIDVALFVFLWMNMRADAQWFVRPGLIIFALLGLVAAASFGQATYGRRYDPDRIPTDLTPS